jgi:hypothetical protein
MAHDYYSSTTQEMLFGRRVGFSGTPSDLLPEELGQCHYDEGVDGQIIHYLTSESIVSSRFLTADWTVAKLLDDVATANPPFHVLLDCGALVTGMSNYDVAKYLLTHGLPASDFDGVVFLDHKDRKMILMRSGMTVVRLNQSGCPPHRRFSFYDQIHTTGMDIHQCIDARAALTLGKDMTFRDYAQGAFRMRGIGKGQTIELFIIPEVMRLVQDQRVRLGNNRPPVSPLHPTPASSAFNNDLLSLSSLPTPSLTPSTGKQLLVDISAWLTLNGMRSENMQFRMLCHQSIDNVSRKRAYALATGHYRELTQLAFAGRAKEFHALVAKASAAKGKGDAIEGDLDLDTRAIFEEDVEAILSVVQSGSLGSSTTTQLIGIETIQKCLDVLTERLDYTVQNSIPVPVPLSEVLRNSIMRRQEFIKNDYDKAVTEKILMVLVNSEGLAKKRFGEPSVAEAAEEDQDANLQKEQVAEEEVLKEQVCWTSCARRWP